MTDAIQRQPHAVLDLGSRRAKAVKIERLLRLGERRGPLRLLEVGTGSGGIAHYFGTHPSGRFEVHAVDVVDNRLVVDGFEYQNVAGVELPFPDGFFDLALSNHVIEHVGGDRAQLKHLSELRRVLAPGGMAYLAVPNRWMLVEPHYSLAFLSWWPEAWRSGWLRLWQRGSVYDCRPLGRADLEGRLTEAGFGFEQIHAEALRATFEIEQPGALLWTFLLRHVPVWMHHVVRGVYPTLIYRLWQLSPAESNGDRRESGDEARSLALATTWGSGPQNAGCNGQGHCTAGNPVRLGHPHGTPLCGLPTCPSVRRAGRGCCE